jgi:hypothetical protein
VPEDVEVRWLHRGDCPPGTSDVLERAVRSLSWPQDERVFVWLAGEAGVLKPLRRWVRDELRLDRCDYDITGYWKRGVADFDDHEHAHDRHCEWGSGCGESHRKCCCLQLDLSKVSLT